MPNTNRREFSQLALALGASVRSFGGAVSIDDTLRSGMERRKIPAVTAVVATDGKITYQGAFGLRDSASGMKVAPDSIFAIASMTKAVTSIAAMQLVEQGKLKLDEPVSKLVPEFAKLEVLDGYDATGKPVLRPARTPVTLKHLLTHTSGLCYDTWSDEMQRYEKAGGATPSGVAPLPPLMFEPGARWQYGYGADWAGRLVEIVSGQTLEQYFQSNILQPLGMHDTSFIMAAEKFDRMVSRFDRQPDGSLKEEPRVLPAPPTAFNGGGGLYSSAADYIKFTQMILRRGRTADGRHVLHPKTVEDMSVDQIGALSAGKLKTSTPERSSDVDMQPGATEKWGLGFLINTTPYSGGRAAGSLAWAGIWNTFYWIDPKSKICAVIMMQFLPFVDKEAVGLLGDFERAVYTQLHESCRMNLRNWFDSTFTHRAEQEALEWAGSVYTFGEIDARSNRMARALAARGLTKGDRMCVYLANSIEMIDLYLACIKTGVIFVPINILYRDREMSHILSDAEPKLLVTAAEIPALLADAALQSGDKLPEAAIDGEDIAALVYTSGTTGASKGAMLTHNNFAVNGASLIQAWKITPADRLLLAPPLFHVHALGNGLHCWLMAACRMRLLERFDYTTAVARFLDFQPTLFFGVPAMYVRLLDTPPLQAFEIGQRMRLFVSGSAPLPAQILEEFRALFGHTILERYGMTETLMNMSNPYEGERRPGSVGLPLPGVIVKIVGPGGNPVAEDETGELWLKGPNVFPGYWKSEEATRAAFVDGWFKTGDIGSRAADGYITLSGRKSDLIISGGFNVYPREIEEFLMEQPEVEEAAVVAEADRVRGEIPVAYVVWKNGSGDPGPLEMRCREKLASFKIPRRFESIEKLPRNALGKVQKHLLCRES